jgi:tetrahydromethanopterin S-methyltransferase subunit E
LLCPLLKSVSTDIIISNNGPILGYSQIGVLSRLSYLLALLHDPSPNLNPYPNPFVVISAW